MGALTASQPLCTLPGGPRSRTITGDLLFHAGAISAESRPRYGLFRAGTLVAFARQYIYEAAMPRTYLIFGDIEGKLDVRRVECTRCERKGRYSVAKLIERYGRRRDRDRREGKTSRF
jgi:hypothetical protein